MLLALTAQKTFDRGSKGSVEEVISTIRIYGESNWGLYVSITQSEEVNSDQFKGRMDSLSPLALQNLLYVSFLFIFRSMLSLNH